MIRNRLLWVGALTVVPIAAFSATGSFASTPEIRPQDTMTTGHATGKFFNEVVLSEEDDAVLHTSFFASGLLASVGADGDKRDAIGLKRVISFACYVTVQEEWETTLTHFLDTLDAASSSSITLSTGYDLEPNPGGSEYDVTVKPKAGLTWGTIADIDDLEFSAKATVAH